MFCLFFLIFFFFFFFFNFFFFFFFLTPPGFIVGEYADLIEDHYQVLEYLLHTRVLRFKPSIQSIFLQNAVKLIIFVAGQVEAGGGEEGGEGEGGI